MSGGPGEVPVDADADAVRADNAELDEQLLALATDVLPGELWVEPGDGEWAVGQNLAHLGEFPTFFAGELERFLDDPRAPIARTHEDPDRLAAVDLDRASRRDLDDLVEGMRRAFARLADVLDRLDDAALVAITQNRRYGEEPLTSFLDRYVIGHKRAHVDQLERTIAIVRSRNSATSD